MSSSLLLDKIVLILRSILKLQYFLIKLNISSSLLLILCEQDGHPQPLKCVFGVIQNSPCSLQIIHTLV